MMKKCFLLFFAFLFGLAGCSSWDDLNKNPYALYDTNSESFVQPIIYNSLKTVASSSFALLPNLMQYTVSTDFETSSQIPYNYVISESNTQNLWFLYNQFGNAQYMLSLARTEENPAMVGVALVLRSYLAQILTDTYGDIPYFKAGMISLQGDEFDYSLPYDRQKDIYVDLLRSMEEANACFARAEELKAAGELSDINFNPLCDFMYDGDVDKWRRFGNSLYLRLLMRVALKVNEESDGIVSLGEEFGDMNVIEKISEIYDCFLSGAGKYPVMRGIEDSARLRFNSMDSALYTPFYSLTNGNWNSQAVCNTIVDIMLVDYKSGNEPESTYDPRYFRYFTKERGAPTQLLKEDMRAHFDKVVSASGNSLIGRYAKGTYTGNHIGDLKMDPYYAILNYDEILFNFAEAGARKWIAMGQKDFKDLYLDANLQSILLLQIGWEAAKDYCMRTSPEVVKFMEYLTEEFDYNKAVEQILRQKYVSTFWVGVEAWADYRRTGYPILKTNGPAAQNKGILPTRLRYPATESYQNAKWYEESLDTWLGGENNMMTDVWWASTIESQSIRLLGRQ